MPKYTRKTGEPWTAVDLEQIRKMVAENTPIRTICARLGRTQAALYRKASQMRISLRPPQDAMGARRCNPQELQTRFSPVHPPDMTLFGLLRQMNNAGTR